MSSETVKSASSAESGSRYKDTLNLPRTSFPMRANLAQNEPLSQKRWEAAGLQRRLAEADLGRPEFIFHDGPPYANGAIHTGHLLNKVLKDMVVRSRSLLGQRCRFVPGWDCHGLPIEHRVVSELVEKGKYAKLEALPEAQRRMAVRRECAAWARKFIELQAVGLRRLLTLGDYEHPYMTMAPEYESAVLEVFAAMVEQGLIYRQLKPVHWSIANRTALAEAELEYEEREDPSIYVDFEALDRDAVAKAFDLPELDTTPSLMIWTTTPWTLPANLAIAVQGRARYSLVEIDGSVTIVASELLPKVAAAGRAEAATVLAETEGRRLIGLEYRHPFAERTGRVVGAEYVTLEDGTGLVHTAPGHGVDDYQTGMRDGLPVYCPVRDDGTYDDSVPEWLRGRSIWDANTLVIDRLRESGHLYHHHQFVHSYPHDWRGHSPVIFRSTEQWFVAVDRALPASGRSLRGAALAAVGSTVAFVPEWGRNRFRGMLESRPDWCISRQRSWGLPIPAFQASDGSILMTPESIRAVARAFAARGSDAWFTESPAQLLAGYDPASDPQAPRDLRLDDLRQMQDIFDVWFESGCSWNAVLRARGLGFPADLYLEGSDQHRGWFQASLLPALAVTGEAPYRTLLTHGFIVDKDGRKMSKSLGNALEVDALLKDYGADVCRWWVSSLAFENDIKLDLEFIRLAGESYRKVRNTLRFLLSNLDDFTPPAESGDSGAAPGIGSGSGPPSTSIDGWLLGEAAALQRSVREAYRTYDFRSIHQRLYDFCNDALSACYCVAVKDRLYCDRRDSPRRRRAQATLFTVADALCRLLAPILPHTADEAFRALWKSEECCVHGLALRDLDAPRDEGWAEVMRTREVCLRALEAAKGRGVDNPLDAGLVVPDAQGLLARFQEDFADLLGVSRVVFDPRGQEVVVQDLRDQPRCERSWRRDPSVRQRSDGGLLSDRDAEAVGVE
jgi:isoleucyl-tRNA synthetase